MFFSLWSKTLSEERLYLIDFSTVKAIKNTSQQLFGSESSFEKMMITSGPTETVDDFLDKLNRTRVVFEVFDSMKSAADEIDLVFRLEIEKGSTNQILLLTKVKKLRSQHACAGICSDTSICFPILNSKITCCCANRSVMLKFLIQ